MSTSTLKIEFDESVAYLIFNRPETMNTFNQQMAEDLLTVRNQLEAHPQCRLLVLRGEGPCFMAGGDVKLFYEKLDCLSEHVLTMARNLHQFILDLRGLPIPVLAIVHGAVAGAGLSIMLAADLVIAEEQTKFNLAYTHLGTSADGGASYALPRLVGMKKAAELMFLAERFDANEALQLGLVNWVFAQSDFEMGAKKIIDRLATGPTYAYSKIKSLLNMSWNNSLEQQLEAEALAFRDSSKTVDFKMGVTSFIHKQKPKFLGK